MLPFKFIIIVIRAKMSLSRAKNIFMPANINSIVILEVTIARKCCRTTKALGIFDGLIQGGLYMGGLIHGRSFVLVINKSVINRE